MKIKGWSKFEKFGWLTITLCWVGRHRWVACRNHVNEISGYLCIRCGRFK